MKFNVIRKNQKNIRKIGQSENSECVNHFSITFSLAHAKVKNLI